MDEVTKEANDNYEKTFQTVTSVIFGKKLTRHADYMSWLDAARLQKVKSCMSGKLLFMPPFSFYEQIKNRVLTLDEAYGQMGKEKLSEEALGNLSLSNAAQTLSGISTITSDAVYGKNTMMSECSLYSEAHYGFHSAMLVKDKYVLYSFWPRQSEYIIGCHYVFSCSFCIKCYNCENLTRCFEMSDCNNCTDSMFCHNCENLSNCMFCFNVKSKKYAIFNVELGKERYMKLKMKLLTQMISRIEQGKKLDCGIFNLLH